MARPRGKLNRSVEGFDRAVHCKSQLILARPGFLAVTCWCERAYFYVPPAWVYEGRTASCGPCCKPIGSATIGAIEEPGHRVNGPRHGRPPIGVIDNG